MTSVIIGPDSIPDMIIDNYPIFKVNNVEKILFSDGNNSNMKWNEYKLIIRDREYLENDSNNNYFNMTCLYDTVFGHWTLEVAIFLVIYKKLQKSVPNIKIYINNNRFYKESILNAFDISKDDIVYEISKDPNTFYLPERISHNCMDFNPKYEMYITNFVNYLESKMISTVKDIDILFLPRGKKENFIGNDRQINNQDNIEQLLKEKYNTTVYNSDNATDNFIDQVQLINRAKIIILTYGSAYSVNSIFLDNCKIIVLGEIGQQSIYPYGKFIYNYILKKNNTLEFIGDNQLFNLDYVCNIINPYM
jgi:capsular polysaccharide biosynthesis protein